MCYPRVLGSCNIICFQGPLPHFSAENTWSSPRRVILVMGEGQGSYGFSLRGHRPARISGVDEDTPAMVSGGWGLHTPAVVGGAYTRTSYRV